MIAAREAGMRRLMAAAVAAVVVLAGCARPVEFPAVPPIPDEVVAARMLQQAHDILDRWEAAYTAAGKPVFAPTYGVAAQFVGPNAAADAKAMFQSQPMVLDAQVPYDVPGPARLSWPDGGTRSITPLTAAQAFDVLRAPAGHGPPLTMCPNCPTVRVTGARYTTAVMEAVDGPVTAPAWEFTFDGFTSKALVPAVNSDAMLVVPDGPWDSAHTPFGLSFDRATSTVDGTVLTAEFVGAKNGADVPCGEDYTLEAVASAHAMVIMIHERRYQRPTPRADNVSCNMIGYPRTASIQLPQALGGRVVLEGTVGHPVQVGKA
jgi:hypothetical protein